MFFLPLIVTAEGVMRLVKSEGKEGRANNDKGTAKRRAHLKKNLDDFSGPDAER